MATLEATTPGASYTGLAIAPDTAGTFLYAANGAQGTIDVFDGKFAPHSFGPNAFVDPELPSGLVPFNVMAINGDLYVTYAPAGHAAQVAAKPGQGAVAAFTTSGRFLSQLSDSSHLASPWGVAPAPAGFGTFSGDLLVGNFAANDSVINAFDPSTGAFRGTLTDASGQAIENPGLWSLNFGKGLAGGDPNTLYFTAGIDGETHGLFGSLQAIPPLSAAAPIVPNLPNRAFQNPTTIPANGDLNPYGVAFVPQGFTAGGHAPSRRHPGLELQQQRQPAGDRLDHRRITPNGEPFGLLPGPVHPRRSGLTTALGVLKSGFVIVGSLPTPTAPRPDPARLPAHPRRNGNVVTTLSDSQLLDGPWDLTINDKGNTAQVFVSNVLNGMVTRIDLKVRKGGNPVVESQTLIALGLHLAADPRGGDPRAHGAGLRRQDGHPLRRLDGGQHDLRRHERRHPHDATRGRDRWSSTAIRPAPARAARPGPGPERRPDRRQRRRGQPRPEPDQRAGRVHARGYFVGQFQIDPAAGGLRPRRDGRRRDLAPGRGRRRHQQPPRVDLPDGRQVLSARWHRGPESSDPVDLDEHEHESPTPGSQSGTASLSPSTPADLTSTSTVAGTGLQSQAGDIRPPHGITGVLPEACCRCR